MRHYVRTAGVMTDLLALLQVLGDHHRGDQPELGMLEHHELGVGLEAVVGLVGERGAVAVLTLNRDGILTMVLQCHSVHCIYLGPGGDVYGAPGVVARVEYLVAVPLPRLGVELLRRHLAPVVEGHHGVRLEGARGEQSAARPRDLRGRHPHQPRLVRVGEGGRGLAPPREPSGGCGVQLRGVRGLHDGGEHAAGAGAGGHEAGGCCPHQEAAAEGADQPRPVTSS